MSVLQTFERSPLQLQNRRQPHLSETKSLPFFRAESKKQTLVGIPERIALTHKSIFSTAMPTLQATQKDNFFSGVWQFVKKRPIVTAVAVAVTAYTLMWLIAPTWFAYVHAMLFLCGVLSLFGIALAKKLLGPAAWLPERRT